MATRDFLYVEDAAKAIVLAAERYDTPEPLNLGSGREVSIRELAHLIAHTGGYCSPRITFGQPIPAGQPRRVLDTTRARDLLGWSAETSLEDGLKKTWDWYKGAV